MLGLSGGQEHQNILEPSLGSLTPVKDAGSWFALTSLPSSQGSTHVAHLNRVSVASCLPNLAAIISCEDCWGAIPAEVGSHGHLEGISRIVLHQTNVNGFTIETNHNYSPHFVGCILPSYPPLAVVEVTDYVNINVTEDPHGKLLVSYPGLVTHPIGLNFRLHFYALDAFGDEILDSWAGPCHHNSKEACTHPDIC